MKGTQTQKDLLHQLWRLLYFSVNTGDPDLEFQAQNSVSHPSFSFQHNYTRVRYLRALHTNKPA